MKKTFVRRADKFITRVFQMGLLTATPFAVPTVYYHLTDPFDDAAIAHTLAAQNKTLPPPFLDRDAVANVFLPGLQASHQSCGKTVEYQWANEDWGDLTVTTGEVDILGKQPFAPEDRFAKKHTQYLVDFWKQYKLVAAINIDHAKVLAAGLFNGDTFTALAVQNNITKKVIVFMPGADNHNVTSFEDLKQGLVVNAALLHSNFETALRFVRAVEKNTGHTPMVVGYSNTCTHVRLLTALGKYKGFELQPPGLKGAAVTHMHDALSNMGYSLSYKNIVKNINANTTSLIMGHVEKWDSGQPLGNCYLALLPAAQRYHENGLLERSTFSQEHILYNSLDAAVNGQMIYAHITKMPETHAAAVAAGMNEDGYTNTYHTGTSFIANYVKEDGTVDLTKGLYGNPINNSYEYVGGGSALLLAGLSLTAILKRRQRAQREPV